MRYVNPPPSPASKNQNLVACQYGNGIFFFTVKEIPANTELFVWYCREFAERIGHPLDADLCARRNTGLGRFDAFKQLYDV